MLTPELLGWVCEIHTLDDKLGRMATADDIGEAPIVGGYVYVLTHPNWPNMCKVGRSIDPTGRLEQFQTGCPERAYAMYGTVHFEDAHHAEALIHEALGEYRQKGEWFQVLPSVALHLVLDLRSSQY